MIRHVYDLTAEALYITIRELADGEYVTRTVEIDLGTMVDEDAAGKILGIEVLSPDKLWPLPEILKRWEIEDTDTRLIMALYGRPWKAEVT